MYVLADETVCFTMTAAGVGDNIQNSSVDMFLLRGCRSVRRYMQSADRRVPSLGGCKSAGQLDEGVYGGTTLGGQFLVRPCSGRSRILERGVLLQAAEGSRTEACSADQSREAQKNFPPLFFSYQGGLSWHLRALHGKFQM